MPVIPPVFLPPPVLAPTAGHVLQDETSPSRRQLYQIASDLRIEYREATQDFETGIMEFRGGVTVFYGPSTIYCESLSLNIVEETGRAEGGVVIEDPEGRVEARELEFDYGDAKTGVARDALVSVSTLRFRTAELAITPEVWTLRDAAFTLEDFESGRTEVTAGKVTIELGRHIRAEHVYFRVLGQKLGPVPYLHMNLDRRVTGLKFPTVAFRSGGRLGVQWNSSVLLKDDFTFVGQASAFPKERPTWQGYVFYAPGSIDNAKPMSPDNDLQERFRDGWFNHIGVKSPETEAEGLRSRRNALGLGTAWNVSTRGRVEDTEVNKSVELVYEYGRPVGDAGLRLTGRGQRLQLGHGGSWVNRGVVGGSFALAPVELGQGLNGIVRFDTEAMVSANRTFGFGRVQAGVVSDPFGGFRVGGAYVFGREFGTPDFAFDRLKMTEGFIFRADYERGPYTVRFLAKYDMRAHEWSDKEWELALKAGSFEPFIQRREFPDETLFGVRFRLNELGQRLQDREIRRVKTE